MFEVFTDSVWAALTLLFVMTLNLGAYLSFSSWQNELKDIYQLSQTQVEILGSVLIFASHSGLIGGVLLEHCGIRKTGCVALATTAAFFGVLATLYHPENFNAELFMVLVVLFIIFGVGVASNYVVVFTVFLQNFSTSYGGRAGAVVALSIASCTTFVSSGLLNVKGLMILFATVQFIASLCCIFLLRRRTESESDNDDVKLVSESRDDNVELKAKNQETGSGDLANKWQDMSPTNQESVSQKKPANEKTPLNKEELQNNSKGKQISVHSDESAWEVLKMLDFWLLMITVVTGITIAHVFLGNIGTYLRSFKAEQHLSIIMSTGPWVYMFIKLCAGIASDIFREKVPRMLFLIMASILETPFMILFLIRGNNIVVMYLMTYLVFTFFGIFYLIGPILLGEYFGVTYFGIYYGAALFANGCLVLLLQFILGVLYDINVTDVSTHTCYGLHCFYVSNGIFCAMSVVILVTSVVLHVRRK